MPVAPCFDPGTHWTDHRQRSAERRIHSAVPNSANWIVERWQRMQPVSAEVGEERLAGGTGMRWDYD